MRVESAAIIIRPTSITEYRSSWFDVPVPDADDDDEGAGEERESNDGRSSI